MGQLSNLHEKFRSTQKILVKKKVKGRDHVEAIGITVRMTLIWKLDV